MVTYNLSAQEREKVRNGEPVNTNGKTTITEPENGTFNSAGQLAKSTMVCGWSNSVHWARCSEGRHGESNYGSCQFVGDFVDNAGNPGFPPYPYLVSTYSCVEQVDETLMPTDPGVGGGGGPAGNVPDECTTVANNPGEVGIINENGCNVGGATQPNDPRPGQKTPCQAIKTVTNDTKYNAHVETLKGKGHLDHEVGYKLSYPVPNSGQNGTQDQIIENHHGTNVLNFSPTNYTFAIVHSHYNNQYSIFSPDDLVALNLWISGAIAHNSNPNNMPRINLKELTISVVTYRGTYLISFDGTSIAPYPAYTQIQWDKLNYDYEQFMIEAGSDSNPDYMEKLETQFFKFTNKYMPMPGMKLFKVESTGNTEIYLENGNHKTKECPK